jgi:hypothetical protein
MTEQPNRHNGLALAMSTAVYYSRQEDLES